jgi:hypothetical protein
MTVLLERLKARWVVSRNGGSRDEKGSVSRNKDGVPENSSLLKSLIVSVLDTLARAKPEETINGNLERLGYGA